MKNLLVINQFASTPENLFGAGERVYHLSPFFKKAGYNVTVISGGYNHLFKKYPSTDGKGFFKKQSFSSLEFIWVRLRKYNHNSFLGRVISWFEFLFKLFFLKLKDKPDIVLVSSMSLLPIVFAIWLKFRYKISFILEIRDIWPLTPKEIGGYSKYHPLIAFLRGVELLGYKYADHIVSVLPGFKDYLEENNLGEKPFTWIPNGVTLDAIEAITDKQTVKLDQDKFNVLYAGTFGKANALEDLIEAAKILTDYNDIHVVLLGEGPSEIKLKSLAKGCENISFLPKVLKSEVELFLKQADICYIGWHAKELYKYGVSANKYNDYMLAKKPILSSSNISTDPVSLARAGIQVKANNSEAIANGILEMYNLSENNRNILGINGYNFVIENQIYPILAKKYIEVLEKSKV